MEPRELAQAVVAGDRRALAKAITLVEGTRREQRQQSVELLSQLKTPQQLSMRIGLTGAPGVGKSTLIDRLGMSLIAKGHRVAVLAIDPSSQVSGGSILGDKVRMESLAAQSSAYIRPTPSSGSLGGVARRSRETMLVCEAAGFDVVLVETVGVGQSEVTVADMVDFMVLMVLPQAGDEMQGVKKGIMEMADAVVIHKCDGALADHAVQAEREYLNALSLVRNKYADWQVPVRRVSSLTGAGIDDLWAVACEFRDFLTRSGGLASLRREQARRWFHAALKEEWLELLQEDVLGVQAQRALVEVEQGRRTPYAAAAKVIRDWLEGRSS